MSLGGPLLIVAAILAALGLAVASGLSAYIPLVLIAVLGQAGFVTLSGPMALLEKPLVIVAVAALLATEMVLDKLPRCVLVSDIVHTPIRAAVGGLTAAFALAAFTGPVIPLVAGAGVALAVHVFKMLMRRPINALTHNVGGVIVSVAEDMVAVVLVLTALLAPAIVLAVVAFGGYVFYKVSREALAQARRRAVNAMLPPAEVAAVPVHSAQQTTGAP